MNRLSIVCLLSVLLGFPALARAQAGTNAVTLAWDASLDADIAGYIVATGTTSGVYTSTTDVGNVTTYAVNGLQAGRTYFFAVRAYDSAGGNSDFSPEVSATTSGDGTTPTPAASSTTMPIDIVWQHQLTGDLSAWHMSGVDVVGTQGLGPGRINLNWKLKGLADFNRDDKMDLVWQNTDGSLAVWFMNGPSIQDTRYLTIRNIGDTNWQVAAVADVNNDGRADIIWQHKTGGWLAAWLIWDNKVLDTRWLTPNRQPDLNWKIAAIGDFDGLKKLSIVWQNQATGALGMTTLDDFVLGPMVPLSTPTLDPAWEIRGARDLNNDGRADLIFEHKTGGWLAAWFMNGPAVIDTRWFSFTQVSDVNWKIVGAK